MAYPQPLAPDGKLGCLYPLKILLFSRRTEKTIRGYYFCLILLPFKGELSFQTFSNWHGYVLWVCSSKFHGLPCGLTTLVGGMVMRATASAPMYTGTEIVSEILKFVQFASPPSIPKGLFSLESWQLWISSSQGSVRNPVHLLLMWAPSHILHFCRFASWLLLFVSWSYLYCILKEIF